MRRLLLVLASLSSACASLNQPPTPGRPEVEIVQQTPIFFGSGSEAPLNLAVTITNPAQEPIVVRRVRVTAGMGMTQYSIRPAERIVRETLAPGQSRELHLTATAYTDRARLTPTEPLGLRTMVEYETGGRRHQELYILLVVGQ